MGVMEACGQEFNNELIARISATVESEPRLSRRALSRRVCGWLDWRSPNGKLKEMTCRTALLKLNRKNLIPLPDVVEKDLFIPKDDVQPADMTAGIDEVTCSLEELGEIHLIPIQIGNRSDSRNWNALMQKYHYLGAGPLCGAQMRYLIESDVYGLIGGLAFSAAAWRVAARDRWIGWCDKARRKNLPKVVCNSRFLLVPKVPNLASHVLGRIVHRIKDDWNARYAIEPVLIETYVNQEKFQGTCYQAANWHHIGSTEGRGRMDRAHSQCVEIKDIYALPINKYFREVLCAGAIGETSPIIVPAPAGNPEKIPENWAEEEFGGADFGDHRLTKRLVTIAQDMYARPQANIPQACQTRAKTKAAYRFFDNSETSMQNIFAPHSESTVRRCAAEAIVLAAQDTTTLNYSDHPATQNLGPIGSSLTGPIGLIVHDTMAFNLQGTPLGLLDVQYWARNPEEFGKKKLRHSLPIEQKESYKWLESFKKVVQAQKQCPNTVFVSVGDREADIYELLEIALADPSGPKLLVRSQHNRRLEKEEAYIWDKIALEPVVVEMRIRVPRRGNRPARDAILAIRFGEVTLKPPDRKSKMPRLTVWAVLAKEPQTPEGNEPIEWRLITTCEVNSPADAIEKVEWYAGRWGIEVYHRTLKSGCKIEERQLGAADRIESCLAIDMVVAWRVHHLTKLGRETPDVPCTVFFEDHEWQALMVYWTRKLPEPDKPPSLREATRMTAQLGGFLGRKCDGEPGTKSLWLGLQRLDDLAAMYHFMLPFVVPHPKSPPVSSNPGCG
jgi:hypothetical protein